MSARTASLTGTGAGPIVLRPDDVRMLQQRLTAAAKALRDLEAALVAIAPQNAMRAEKFAEECEAVAEAVNRGEVFEAQVAKEVRP